jgi:hypothetical protein
MAIVVRRGQGVIAPRLLVVREIADRPAFLGHPVNLTPAGLLLDRRQVLVDRSRSSRRSRTTLVINAVSW